MASATSETPLSAEQVFDAVGPAYEAAFAGLVPQEASIAWLLDQLKDQKPAKVLDIGCGTGRPVCYALAEAGHDVLGIDISSAMIEDARKKVPKASFQKVDVSDYKPGAESLDAVTVYFSMIASVTQDQIRKNIENIYGWLRPGGVFVFATVPVAGNNMTIRWMGHPVVVSSLTVEDTLAAVRDVGFNVVHHEASNFLPHGAEAGICKAEEVWEEPHVFIYARKP